MSNTAPVHLRLYSTAGCHLCDEAEALVRPLVHHFDWQLTVFDIADRPDWVDQYGVRIPVLQVDGLENDLGWPFDQESVVEYLSPLTQDLLKA